MARYNVIDRETAKAHGISCNGEYNAYVLVGMRDGKVDDVVGYGWKQENLQTIADKRNAELDMTKRALIKDSEPADPLVGLI